MFIKVALVGGPGVGKTQIFRRLCTKQPFQVHHVPTLTPSFSALPTLSDASTLTQTSESVLVQVWDLPSHSKASGSVASGPVSGSTLTGSTSSSSLSMPAAGAKAGTAAQSAQSGKLVLPPIFPNVPQSGRDPSQSSSPTPRETSDSGCSLSSEHLALVTTSDLVVLVCDLTSMQSLAYLDRLLVHICNLTIAKMPQNNNSNPESTPVVEAPRTKVYPFSCILVINKCEPVNAPRQAFRSHDVNALCSRHPCIKQVLEFSAVLNINVGPLHHEILRLGLHRVQNTFGVGVGIGGAETNKTAADPTTWKRSAEAQDLRSKSISRAASQEERQAIEKDLETLTSEAETRARIERVRDQTSSTMSEAMEREAAQKLAREALEAQWGVDAAARRVAAYVKFDLESCSRFRKLFGAADVIPLSYIQIVMHRIGHPAWSTPLVVRRLVWATSSLAIQAAGLGANVTRHALQAHPRLGGQWVETVTRMFGRAQSSSSDAIEPRLSYPEFMWLLDAIFHGDLETRCQLVWAVLQPVMMETDEEEWFDENDPGIVPDDIALLGMDDSEASKSSARVENKSLTPAAPSTTSLESAQIAESKANDLTIEVAPTQDMSGSSSTSPGSPSPTSPASSMSLSAATSPKIEKKGKTALGHLSNHTLLPLLAAARRQIVIAAGTAKFCGTKARTPARQPLPLPPPDCTTAEHVERLFSAMIPYLPPFKAALHTGLVHGQVGLTALELRKALRPVTKKLASEFLAAFAGPRSFVIRKSDFFRKVRENPALLSLWEVSAPQSPVAR